VEAFWIRPIANGAYQAVRQLEEFVVQQEMNSELNYTIDGSNEVSW